MCREKAHRHYAFFWHRSSSANCHGGRRDRFILRWPSAIAATLAAVAIAFILRWQSLHFAPAVGDRCDVGGRRDRSHFAPAVGDRCDVGGRRDRSLSAVACVFSTVLKSLYNFF